MQFLASLISTSNRAEVADSWEPLKELPPSAADAVYVVDAMAFIQRFNTLGSSTFGQLQERYREKLLNMKPRHCTEVHFVGDQYDFGLKSLKGDERQRRESNINLPEYVPADSMEIPDWKTLLSNPCNKTNMMSYLASRWSQEASWPAGFCLVLGVNAQATRVTQMEHTDVDELYCPNHEEADTRIFAHIASCDDNNAFVIQATDTDIIVLAMYHFPRLPNVVELWVEKNDLFLSIHDLVSESAKAVGKDVLALTDTLLISYILSGCDLSLQPSTPDYLNGGHLSLSPRQLQGRPPLSFPDCDWRSRPRTPISASPSTVSHFFQKHGGGGSEAEIRRRRESFAAFSTHNLAMGPYTSSDHLSFRFLELSSLEKFLSYYVIIYYCKKARMAEWYVVVKCDVNDDDLSLPGPGNHG
ncbi:hypothetical protein GQR58_004551 [Nymphon striatum]|nr:hypothetical protein GQR58_004551 [Nymphon striatum]